MKQLGVTVHELLRPEVLPISEEFGEAEREAVVRAMQELSSIEVRAA